MIYFAFKPTKLNESIEDSSRNMLLEYELTASGSASSLNSSHRKRKKGSTDETMHTVHKDKRIETIKIMR
jgi:hypothetical protein